MVFFLMLNIYKIFKKYYIKNIMNYDNVNLKVKVNQKKLVCYIMVTYYDGKEIQPIIISNVNLYNLCYSL